jgi:aryl-alcohol dehydrogenase-like predicted oxidoreductase/predicted dehydrogenase
MLCEKPLCLNHAEAMAVVEAARANDVFLMEAFMYRCHPQTAKLVELIRSGAIGEVRAIEATFGFNAHLDPAGRLFNQALGGGGILDVGCYAMSMARLIAGAAVGKDFDEPTEVSGVARIGEVSRVDECAFAAVKFPSGIIAQLGTAVQANLENVVRVFGAEGWIFVPQPWMVGRDGGKGRILVHRAGQEDPEEVLVEGDASSYTLEADMVATHLERRQAASPAMTWDDSLGNMKGLDRWREAIGLVYDSERLEAGDIPVTGRPLAHREGHSMPYGAVDGVEKPIARIVMGVVCYTTPPHTAAMCDDYFERGGNCFDAAYIYGGGRCEQLLGQWMKSRGVREDVVILAKGAHSPHNQPERLGQQLAVSLDRMQTDYVDLLMAHRDNEEIPVDEWVDAFNELLQAGRIRAYGVSNWTVARAQEASEYASANGLVGVAAVSNNFSLAHMVEAPWRGCLAASDPESRDWFGKTQTPLFAWSSLAQGFFTDRGDPQDRSDGELVRCWHSEDNFRRRERAQQLAEERGVLPIQIALAHVLSQPFPTFAIIGAGTIAETSISCQALDVELTPENVRWLNLED